ncbi:MAG: hypothetical protein V3U43_06540 [Pseudomonadales bacterium]
MSLRSSLHALTFAWFIAPATLAGESPCAGDAYRAFDFWVGQWEVFLEDGRKAGDNRISVREGGCLLLEEWRGVRGSTGTSMNFYDPASEQWVQVWMGSGSLIRISGGIVEDAMSLQGEITDLGSHATLPFRGLWTPLDDGRVRQFFEQSEDDGETWSAWFEGFYVKKAQR